MLKKYNQRGVDSSAQILTVFPQYCYFQLSIVLNMLMGLQGSSVCSEKGVADLPKAKAPQEELVLHDTSCQLSLMLNLMAIMIPSLSLQAAVTVSETEARSMPSQVGEALIRTSTAFT